MMMRPIVPVTKRPETMGSQLDNMNAQAEGSTVALRGLVAQLTNDIAVQRKHVLRAHVQNKT